jgi:hypothetical protein
MHSVSIFLLCLVVSLARSKSVLNPECEVCRMFCEYGYILDEKSCPICECKQSPCENGQEPLDGYFCGRGPDRRECPSTHQCMIAPNDAYAVCCPASSE